jgi:hypothetical protein
MEGHEVNKLQRGFWPDYLGANQSGKGLQHSKTLAGSPRAADFPELLERGCPLPLWVFVHWRARISKAGKVLTGSTSLVTWAVALTLAAFLCGCASPDPPVTTATRRFQFERDTFAFTNELRWEYFYDAEGKWTTRNREPKPSYWQHCFVLARSARQFFINARFDEEKPPADERTYRTLIRRVVASNPRKALPEAEKIEIPGYACLREFSRGEEKLLKEECGGAWESYFQRGHWRAILPFSRHHQEQMAAQLLKHLKQNPPLVIHLMRFPSLTINHAMVLFDARETEKEIEFIAYDPNLPAEPRTVSYDRASRTFLLAPNDYFPGGRVDVYEVDHKWNY